jgi:hypothetical protein
LVITGGVVVAGQARAAAAPGTWSAQQTWPIAPLATHLLYNGKVITWDGWQQPQPSVVWDPADPTKFTTINAPDSVFCDGAAHLPDGRLLVIGGYGGLSTGQIGIVDTSIFDPATQAWSRVADMNYPRWYPTVTELADGRFLAISGNSTNERTWADTPEVYDPVTNKWTLLTGVSTAAVHEVEYPFSYLVPSGDVFVMGPEEDNSHLLNVDNKTWTSTGASGLLNGSSVMYRPGKVLYSGGAALIDTPSAAQKSTAVIDLTSASPTWRQTAPMSNSRIYHTLTMLADGDVLSIGGANTSDQKVITTGVLPTEIWNPVTETWTAAAPIAAARNYHSTAILLPDARVMVSGGGHPAGLQDAAQFSSQIYSPSYLTQGARPTITSIPAAATYGSTIPVTSPDAAGITAVNLVSLGADTHQIDMSQHFVPLNFSASGGTVTVQAPTSGALAPPGYYMLFILKNGVPSVSKMVHIGGSAALTVPGVPTTVTAAAGNASATVNWTAPTSGGSPITNYTVTPFIGATGQFPTTISGTPPATEATISGLTNGTTYTFKVTAKNSVGPGTASAPSNPVTPGATATPAFIQQVAARGVNVTTAPVTLPGSVTAGNRLVVEVGIWNVNAPTTSGVTDSAGNTYTKLSSIKASDDTELSVWSAPVTAGGGTKPVITARGTQAGDIGITAMEYSGLSPAAGPAAVDVQSAATGQTTAAATVSSGATPVTSAGGQLALGFYADSGFGNSVTPGSGWIGRANLSPNGTMDLRTEDQSAAAGSAPAATFGTGGNTPWLAATVVFKSAVAVPPTVPAAPTGITAAAGNKTATINWSAPPSGGSPITSYVVTPYMSSTAQTPVIVSGTPPATTTNLTGLMNNMAYTFTVTARNAIGYGPPSSASNSITPTATVAPTFVQKVTLQTPNTAALAVTPAAPITTGNRIIVQVGVWNAAHATTTTVRDAVGNVYTKLLNQLASDGTEMSVWSAVITAGGGTKPTITATTTSAADVGIVALEYAGLATSSPVDVSATATGTTTAAGSVSSGATPMATAAMGLSLGFYADSGFGTTLGADPGYSARANLSPNGNMDLLVEDTMSMMGAMPAASVRTGANTVWLMATIVFKAT